MNRFLVDDFRSYLDDNFSEKGVIESVVELFHDVVEKVPQVSLTEVDLSKGNHSFGNE